MQIRNFYNAYFAICVISPVKYSESVLGQLTEAKIEKHPVLMLVDEIYKSCSKLSVFSQSLSSVMSALQTNAFYNQLSQLKPSNKDLARPLLKEDQFTVPLSQYVDDYMTRTYNLRVHLPHDFHKIVNNYLSQLDTDPVYKDKIFQGIAYAKFIVDLLRELEDFKERIMKQVEEESVKDMELEFTLDFIKFDAAQKAAVTILKTEIQYEEEDPNTNQDN